MLLALLGREARTGGLVAPNHHEAVQAGVLAALAWVLAALWLGGTL